jgi:N-acetyl-anhydromuramyl-L-alanine amidase AmpD
VCTSKRAWHAGVSCLNEITDVNSLSIGIELDYPGPNKHGLFPAYPSLQIEALIKLLDVLTTLHSIAKDSIVGHSDVAPNRKIDPGPSFPWDHLKHHGFSKDVLKNKQLVSPQ